MHIWAKLRLTSRFMIIIAIGVAILVGGAVLAIARYERTEMEERLRTLSINEMTSLHALILNVMAKRPEDSENVGIQVFNNWFDSRNVHYPGKVWSVWSPKVAAYMAETAPDHAPKVARDTIDGEALVTGRAVGRMEGGNYRYSLPIVLGVTDGADQEVCYGCHGAMGLGKGDVIAVLSSSLSTADSERRLKATLAWLAGGGCVALLLAVIGIRLSLQRLIAGPIGDMTGRMARLAAGDAAIDIPETTRRDEIGDIARAVEVFKTNAIAKQAMERDAKRDSEARERRFTRLESLIHQFERAVASVIEGVTVNAAGLSDSARRMVDQAEMATASAESVARQADQASTNVQVVSDAAEKLSAAIGEITRQVGLSTSVTVEATREAETANGKVRQLAEAADTISQIIGTIAGIAEQTNLLALNATIEAARAGDAGKGFSVVAGEVKNLARQTVNATDVISSQITAIQGQTNETVITIQGINHTIASMDGISGSIAAAIERQDAATQDIARNIVHAATGTRGVYDGINAVTNAINETDRVAHDVFEAVARMQSEADRLRNEVDRFLTDIRNS